MIARAGVFYGRRAAVRPKWYVDSAHGNDANDGAGPGGALRTIAAVEARMQAGDRIGLARGSVWRERFELTAERVEVIAYGAGERPLLDASDPVPAGSWTKTAGYTNVYQCTVTVDAPGWISVWEDNVRFLRAASMTELDATAGRYLPEADPGGAGPVTLFVHASDSSDPATNGKSYEYSRRSHGLYTGQPGCKVTGIHTRRNLGNNGSLEVGRNSVLTDCVASEGTKHNILVHGGATLKAVEAANSYYAGQAKVLVSWNEDVAEGQDITLLDCYAHDEFEGNATAFYGHRNVSGTFGRILLRGCRTDHVLAALPASDEYAEVIIDRCDLWVIGCAVDTTITNSVIRGNLRCLNIVWGPVITIRDSLVIGNYSALDGSDTIIYAPLDGARLDIQRSRVEGTLKDGQDQMTNGIWMSGASATLISRNNTFLNLARFYMIDTDGYTVDSDYNTFSGPIVWSSFRLPGWQWKTIPQWKTETGQDSHSTP